MKEKIIYVFLMCILVLGVIGGMWYIISPASVRNFCRKYPIWDRFGKMRKASDMYIRAGGILILIVAGFMLYGLWNLLRGI